MKTLAILTMCIFSTISFFAGRSTVDPANQIILKRAIDGDTVELTLLGRCRIVGIDTPELWKRKGRGGWVRVKTPQYGAEESFNWLNQFSDQPVSVKVVAKDRYGRNLIHLTLPGGVDAASTIKKNGWIKRKKK